MNEANINSGDAVNRAQSLALAMDYLTEQDLCALCGITASTAEAWRKRHKGPLYSLAGNRVLYPRAAVREFLDSQVRERITSAKAVL
jgi:hypothetical protein